MNEKITKIEATNCTYIIAGDWHSYYIHEASYQILLKYAKHLRKISPIGRKIILIINGDFIDCEYLMPRSKVFKQHIKSIHGIEGFFIPEMEREAEAANKMLDILQDVFDDIIFVAGNHDERIDYFGRDFAPVEYKHHFSLSTQLKLKERKILHIKYNNWLDIGKVSVTHGQFHGATCHKKHYEVVGGRSVIFSHIHKYECKSFQSRGDTHHSWSLPAMCTLSPIYLKNQDNNWSNGFGELVMRKDGQFNFNVHQVWDGKLVLGNGEIITG